MKVRNIVVAVVLSTIVLAVSTLGIVAQNARPIAVQENSSNTRSVMPFYGKIAEIDRGSKTVKIGKRTFHVTAQTKLIKDGKQTTFDSAQVGLIAGGSFKEVNGRLELQKLRIGPKTQAELAASAKSKKQ